MKFTALFSFEAGQVIPSWLYSIDDLESGQSLTCRFGTSGKVALLVDGALAIWPSRNREQGEYIFTVENGYLFNGWAGHPAGNDMLKVLPSEEAARFLWGDSIDGQSHFLPDIEPDR